MTTRYGFVSLANLALITLSGCSILPQATEDPTRYYVLTSQVESSGSVAVTGKFALSIRNIELPPYLRNSKSIVVRRGANEVRYEDFARWAEPLELGIHRVIKERLAAAPMVRALVSPPFSISDPRDFDVRVRLLRCEGATTPDGRKVVLFSANYEITRGTSGGEIVVRRTFVGPEMEWDGTDFGALAARLSEVADQLGSAIAADLPANE